MKITIQTIKDLNLCADRFKNFMAPYPVFEGTHQDFLSLEKISHSDKLWVLLRLMPRFYVEVFAIDCAASAANSASYSAAYAASDETSYAANAASDAATYAASAASYAASAASVAAYAAYAAAYAANAAAYATPYAANYVTERERQLEAISYLINSSEELNEKDIEVATVFNLTAEKKIKELEEKLKVAVEALDLCERFSVLSTSGIAGKALKTIRGEK